MKPSLLVPALETILSAGLTAFIWGPPGVGKSSIADQIAQKRSVNFMDLRAVQLDPVDLRGLPKITPEDRTTWCIPDFLPQSGKGILFLDELMSAPRLVQAAFFQLILDRRLGSYRLPDGWSIVAASNREGDRGIVNRMSTPLANRFTHLNFDVDYEDWAAYALTHDFDVKIIAFLRFRRELLMDFDPDREEKAFASPRSWEFASKLMKKDPAPEILQETLAGAVGAGPAAEFKAFLDLYASVPNPDTVMLNPKDVPIPDEPSTLYALILALAKRACANTFGQLMKFGSRLEDEFSMLMVKSCELQDPDIRNTPTYSEWLSDKGYLFS